MRRITRGDALFGTGKVKIVASGGTSLIVPSLAGTSVGTLGTVVLAAVTGAASGDFVQWFPGTVVNGMIVTGGVPAAGSVSLQVINVTGAAINMGTATWRYQVWRST